MRYKIRYHDHRVLHSLQLSSRYKKVKRTSHDSSTFGLHPLRGFLIILSDSSGDHQHHSQSDSPLNVYDKQKIVDNYTLYVISHDWDLSHKHAE